MKNLPERMSAEEGIRELSDFFLGENYYDLVLTYKMDRPIDGYKFVALIVKKIEERYKQNVRKIIFKCIFMYILIEIFLWLLK